MHYTVSMERHFVALEMRPGAAPVGPYGVCENPESWML